GSSSSGSSSSSTNSSSSSSTNSSSSSSNNAVDQQQQQQQQLLLRETLASGNKRWTVASPSLVYCIINRKAAKHAAIVFDCRAPSCSAGGSRGATQDFHTQNTDASLRNVSHEAAEIRLHYGVSPWRGSSDVARALQDFREAPPLLSLTKQQPRSPVSRSAAANPAARSSGFIWPRMRMQTLKFLRSTSKLQQQQEKEAAGQQQEAQQQHSEDQQGEASSGGSEAKEIETANCEKRQPPPTGTDRVLPQTRSVDASANTASATSCAGKTDSPSASAAAAASCEAALRGDASEEGLLRANSLEVSATECLLALRRVASAQVGKAALCCVVVDAVDRERLASAALHRICSQGSHTTAATPTAANAAADPAASAAGNPPAAAAGATAAAAAATAAAAEEGGGPPYLQQWLRQVCKLKTVVAVGESDQDPLLLQFLRYLQDSNTQCTEAVMGNDTKQHFALFVADARIVYTNQQALRHFGIQEGFTVLEVPFNIEQRHFPYAEAAACIQKAHDDNMPVLVFDACGDVLSPGAAASFLVMCGFGVIKAISHVKRKADYARLDSSVVTELYRLTGGMRQPTERGLSLIDDAGPLLVSSPVRPRYAASWFRGVGKGGEVVRDAAVLGYKNAGL
ncbi:maternal protein pumilio-like, partial [Cyclospora cayetanensis]|uniref:Maternal protein pumilio-like n=1 Tax=Cyclospora cayetanensis TaxID=88456 RepID=A0A6P6RZJ3_9EIME